jgi:hypothetical protein
MGEWGGSWGGVFCYDLLKEVRYIYNEYAVLGDKICCKPIPSCQPIPSPLIHPFLKPHKHQHQISHPFPKPQNLRHQIHTIVKMLL